MEEEEARRQGVPLGRRFYAPMTTNDGIFYDKYQKLRSAC